MKRSEALELAYEALDDMPRAYEDMENEEARNIIGEMIAEEENKEKTA